ncbi:MAG: AAA family ATPase [Clostridium sp.]
MYRELFLNEIKYKFNIGEIDINNLNRNYLSEYEDVYEKISSTINIEGKGYNLYIVDECNDDKIKNLVNHIDNILKERSRPKDICFACEEDKYNPRVLYISGGRGQKFKKCMDKIKEEYLDLIFDFYNTSICEEKEDILQEILLNKDKLLNELIKLSEENGFYVKTKKRSFVFSPIKEGKPLTDEEFEELNTEEKNKMIRELSVLKVKSKELVNKLKYTELEWILKVRTIFFNFLSVKMEEKKLEFLESFKEEADICEYIRCVYKGIEEKISNNYTSRYEEDEPVINEIVYNYQINILLDNSDVSYPRVIYETEPNIQRLIGKIEYENYNGIYKSTARDVKPGAILKSSEGVLILRAMDLLNYPQSYSYLKKVLNSESIDFEYSKNYLDALSIKSIRPELIKVKPKVIIIGDYRVYNILYSNDDDFKNAFRVMAESNYIKIKSDKEKENLTSAILSICKQYRCKPLSNEALKEVARYLSMQCEDKRKLYFDNLKLTNLIVMANNTSIKGGKKQIESEDIIKIANSHSLIESKYLEQYRDKKMFISVDGKIIGCVNGLSVIDTGYSRFGKPIRITCTCYKGSGNIIDVQKESDLSGKIHNKSINILKGLITTLFDGYDDLPVDFHLNFEQIYGLVEGDSASAAETIAMLSSLSKVPVKQNIAITGSVNQFGEIQPVGGINEKIDGFIKVCNVVHRTSGKGIIIPSANIDALVLTKEVEGLIEKGEFKIYTVDTIYDVIDVIMGDVYVTYKDVLEQCKREFKKYSGKSKK